MTVKWYKCKYLSRYVIAIKNNNSKLVLDLTNHQKSFLLFRALNILKYAHYHFIQN